MDKLKENRVHRLWNDIKRRCYDPSVNAYKSYGAKGVVVCDEWQEFAPFYEWYKDHYYSVGNERMCVDKDIMEVDNKVYGPDKCIIVPIKINNMLVGLNDGDKELPTGVRHMGSRYSVSISTPTGKARTKYFGSYDTVEKASRVYKLCKTVEYLKLLKTYEGRLPSDLYNVLTMVDLF